MAEGQENTKSRIVGLIATRRIRGLKGASAATEWSLAALEILLEAELARIEKREKDNG